MSQYNTVPSHPRRPDDVPPLATYEDLLAAHHRHALALVDDRCRIGVPLTRADVAAHALAGLAVDHALAERLLAHRWLTAAEAMTAGASLAEVAEACGLDVDEVRAGVRSWADGQERLRAREGRFGLSRAEAAEVRALVDVDPAGAAS